MRKTVNTLSNSKLIRNLKPYFYNQTYSSLIKEHVKATLKDNFNSREEFDRSWDERQNLDRLLSYPDRQLQDLMRHVHRSVYDAIRTDLSVN